MKFLKTAVDEIVGLFVDDWRFAALVIAWIIIFNLIHKSLPSSIQSPLLVVPFGLFVLVFVLMRAKAGK